MSGFRTDPRTASTPAGNAARAGFTVFGGQHAPYIWLETPPGTTSWEHWLEDRGAHEVRLTPADVARLDDLVNDATVAGPRYSESQQASIDTEAAPPR